MRKSTDNPVLDRSCGRLVALMLLATIAGNALAADGDSAVEEGALPTVESATNDPGPAESASGRSGFHIDWQTIDGGATRAAGGNYQLRGTVGQADADPAHPAQSADFDHTGGFWSLFLGAGVSLQVRIFSDRFEDGSR